MKRIPALLLCSAFSLSSVAQTGTGAADTSIGEVVVTGEGRENIPVRRFSGVHDFTVFEGKKNEVVVLKNISANTAANNPRQIYGSVTGLNIWESDGAGLQLGIGGRGLSPSRSSAFNIRQNGYDISADALGYPESYYTPPAEALERLEIIRGAAGLQYGTQFGGAVNFIFKQPSTAKPFEYVGRQSAGSWGFLNSFNSFSGSLDSGRIGYYAYYQRKQGNGWRPHSQFGLNNAYVHIAFIADEKTKLGLDVTHMDYLAQQPGGLTDAMFDRDARQSVRSRNWFRVDWNLTALHLTRRLGSQTEANVRVFGLLARRQALGNLERINVVDFGGARTMIDGRFRNIGGEARIVHRYTGLAGMPSTLVAGVRLYRGTSSALQGDADSGSDATFRFIHPDYVEGSDYAYTNDNAALFAEHIFRVAPKLSLTPGVRVEALRTTADGYYRQRVFDFAGNVVADQRNNETLSRPRALVIAGLGAAFTASKSIQLYGNFSQNYRAINYTDLRIQNPSLVIDSNLQDERGYTADLGVRGAVRNVFSYEVTAFHLFYNNRIGQVLRTGAAPLYLDYRFRTNVAASRTWGIETYGAVNLARLLLEAPAALDWTVFVNTSLLDATYVNSQDPSIEGKEVEMVPPVILRTGTQAVWSRWRAGFQVSYTAQHFSDASNAVRTATAVEGIIPAYTVADLTASYRLLKWLTLEASCNNLFDARYFTRRAESYPGPGIIPGDGRAFYGTVEVRL